MCLKRVVPPIERLGPHPRSEIVEQIVLAVEASIERANRRVGLPDDGVHGQAGRSLGGKELEGGGHDPLQSAP